MKKQLLFIVGIMLSLFSVAQDYQLDWVKQSTPKNVGPGYYCKPTDVVVDAVGNSYSVGYFVDTVDFDSGPGVVELNSIVSGGVIELQDVFLQKLDPNGNLIWVKRLDAQSLNIIASIAIDANGDIIVVYEGNLGIGTATYISKIHESGNIIWQTGIGHSTSSSRCYGRGVLTDDQNNIYVTGLYKDTIDLPLPGGSFSVSNGYKDVYVAKLNSIGTVLWGRTFGGSLFEEVNGLSMDSQGNLFLTGYFNNTVDFDPGAGVYNLTSNGQRDVYVLKLDTLGDFVWARSFGSAGSTGSESDSGTDIIVDHNDDLIIVGFFVDNADFDPGSGVFNVTSNGSRDIFVEKLDNDGNFIWAKNMGGTSPYDEAYAVAVDSSNNIYVTGRFSGTGDFDPGTGVDYLFGTGGALTGYVQKLDANGNNLWAESLSSGAQTEGHVIYVDAQENLYALGFFSGAIDFDWTAIDNTLTAGGKWDAYIMKLSDHFASIDENSLDNLSVFPNPTNGMVTLSLGELKTATIKVRNIQGQLVYSKKINDESLHTFNLNQKAGIYFIEVSNVDFTRTLKLIKE